MDLLINRRWSLGVLALGLLFLPGISPVLAHSSGNSGAFSENSGAETLKSESLTELEFDSLNLSFSVADLALTAEAALPSELASLPLNPVPEPSTWVLMGLGVFGMLVSRQLEKFLPHTN